MGEWFHATPSLLTAVALVTLPGLPAALVLRLRGLTLVAASIAASIAVVAISTILAPFVNISWGATPVAVTAVALAIILLPTRIFTRDRSGRQKHSASASLWVAGAVAVAGGLIGVTISKAIGAPENISQTFDGVFHVNMAAQILISGDASPFHVDLNSPGYPTAFYPTVWHAVVALIAQLSGATVPVATNALALATSAWIWPVAILFFARPFFATRHAHLILGAIVASSFTAFPYLLVSWGVLYPNLLSTALIPIALGFLYPALRYRHAYSPAAHLALWVAAAGAVFAAALAHPNGIFGIAAFSIPMLLVCANDTRKLSASLKTKLLRWAGIGCAGAIYIAMWVLVRTGDNSREFGTSLVGALINGISNAQMLDTRAWFLTVLVAGGVVVLLANRRHRWLILSYSIVLALFVISSGLSGAVRDTFTGAWYNDAHRLAALLPIGAIPLASIAAARLFDYASEGIARAQIPNVSAVVRKSLPAIGALLIFGLVLTGARGQNFALQSGWISDLHNPTGVLLSEDERTLLERLPEVVPEDALIAGDPWTGAGLALAISQREVLFPHLKGSYSAETMEIAQGLDELGSGACPILQDLGVTYLLDFGSERYSINQDELFQLYAGLHGVQRSPIVSKVDSEGEATLFRVECG